MSSAGAVAALVASVVIILGALGGVARLILRIALTVRDNTAAVRTLRDSMDARFNEVGERLGRLERRRRF